MRIPFALNLRVGTDIIAKSRLLNPMQPNRSRLERLATRFLHPRELQDFTQRFPQWRDIENQSHQQRERISSWLAGRWAAKEAGKKAWGATILGFEDLRVERVSEDGDIQLICSPAIKLSDETPEQAAQLSISHDGDYAIATVLATSLHHDIIKALGHSKAEADKKVTAHTTYPDNNK